MCVHVMKKVHERQEGRREEHHWPPGPWWCPQGEEGESLLSASASELHK